MKCTVCDTMHSNNPCGETPQLTAEELAEALASLEAVDISETEVWTTRGTLRWDKAIGSWRDWNGANMGRDSAFRGISFPDFSEHVDLLLLR